MWCSRRPTSHLISFTSRMKTRMVTLNIWMSLVQSGREIAHEIMVKGRQHVAAASDSHIVRNADHLMINIDIDKET